MVTLAAKVARLIERVENTEISFWQIVMLFVSIPFMRGFFEVFVNANNYGMMAGFIDIFFTYPTFFIIVFLGFIIILRLSTKESLKKITNFVALCSPIILLPPLADFIYHWGKPIVYNYLAGSYGELLGHFATFSVFHSNFGFGIKLEIALVLIATFIYLMVKIKKWVKSALTTLALYAVIFIGVTMPVHIYAVYNIFASDSQPVNRVSMQNFFFPQEQDLSSVMNRSLLVETSVKLSPTDVLSQNVFSTVVSISQMLLVVALLVVVGFLYSKEKSLAVFRNFRLNRILHYSLLIILGFYLGVQSVAPAKGLALLFGVLSLVSVILSFVFAWLFSVWENDEVDCGIDAVSNPDRPLIKGSLSQEEWKACKWLFLVLALAFGYLSGYYALILVLMYMVVYHIYSVPPLRLKRVIGLSSMLVGFNCLLAVFAGYFIGSGSVKVISFPVMIGWGIFILFTLAENVKNIKDIEGDRKAGIRTLPVILGEVWGKRVVGLLVASSAVMFSMLFGFKFVTFATSVIFGGIMFHYINKPDYREKHFFFVYLIYLVVLMLEISI